MNKIPCLYKRNYDLPDRPLIIGDITPGCEWVIAGEGVPTRKYDGTCMMLDMTGQWWSRREMKKDKPTPANFLSLGVDPITGKTMGWEPVTQSGWVKFWREAVCAEPRSVFLAGTYELCGPKIMGNPEEYHGHILVPHDRAERIPYKDPLDIIEYCRANKMEGVVWHHPDGRMCKLKVRDIPTQGAKS